jgi:3-oxoacyl-[acyl-carrier-protein] synthase-3
MGSKIIETEYYLPKNILSNKDLERDFPEWSADKIEEKLGIRERRIADKEETALDMGQKAAEKVLSKYKKETIDFLLFCTESPDYFIPPNATILQDRLGLRTNLGAFDFSLACSGYIYGLSIAKGLISSNVANHILLITSETYSKHIHLKDKSNRTIFGDAAAATLISKSDNEGIGEFSLGTDGKGYDKLIVPNGCFRNSYDPNAKPIEYTEGSYHTANNVYMNGPEIFNFTIKAVPQLVDDVLRKNELSFEAIDFFIFHQANIFMIEYLRKKINIPKKKFYEDMLLTGNTVCCTIPIALKNSIENGTIIKGDKVLLAGFGVGYSWGATILTI